MSIYTSKCTQAATYHRIFKNGHMLCGDEAFQIITQQQGRIAELEAKLKREYQVVAGNDIRIANMGERIAELEDEVKYHEQKEITKKSDKLRKKAGVWND